MYSSFCQCHHCYTYSYRHPVVYSSFGTHISPTPLLKQKVLHLQTDCIYHCEHIPNNSVVLDYSTPTRKEGQSLTGNKTGLQNYKYKTQFKTVMTISWNDEYMSYELWLFSHFKSLNTISLSSSFTSEVGFFFLSKNCFTKTLDNCQIKNILMSFMRFVTWKWKLNTSEACFVYTGAILKLNSNFCLPRRKSENASQWN